MIQIDIEMPKTCYDCPLAMMRYVTLFRRGKQISNEFSCVLTHKKVTSTKRNRFCPLKMVKVVRCIECKYASISEYRGELYISCENTEGLFGDVPEDGFCYLGEELGDEVTENG